MLGAAVAALAAGIVRDSVGDYAPAFVAARWIAIIAGLAALGIRRPKTGSGAALLGPEPLDVGTARRWRVGARRRTSHPTRA